ncbi:acyl-CoA dehydrogenase family protein, partial [Streptomyces sp. DT225]
MPLRSVRIRLPAQRGELLARREDGAELHHLVWRLGPGWRVCSSAVLGGGIGPRAWILNAQVPGGYPRMDPDRHLAGIAAAEHLLEITTAYVKEREAFGRPLSKLQHIRFEIAEMATECAVTRAFLDRCIVDHSDGTLDAVHASMAKWWATELQKRVADRCLQLHG